MSKTYSLLESKKLYGNKEEICQIFGVAKGTLSNDLTLMRRNPEFSNYILRPGHGRVNISITGYEKFLKFRSEARKKNVVIVIK